MQQRYVVLGENWLHANISVTCLSMAAAYHYSIHIDFHILKEVNYERCFWAQSFLAIIHILAMGSTTGLNKADRKLLKDGAPPAMKRADCKYE